MDRLDQAGPDQGTQSAPSVARELLVSGSGRDRGRQHGEALRSEIHAALDRWREVLRAEGFEPQARVAELIDGAGFVAAARRWAPDLLEEVAGIADGAAADRADVLAYQLADESWWYGRSRHASPAEGACSVIGLISPRHGVVLAQNMDLPVHFDGAQTLLRVAAPGRPEVTILTSAGYLGLTGMNGAGVGVCCNTLLDLPSSASGLPVAFIVRSVLAMDSADAAAALLRRIRHASGQNYMIGDRSTLVDLECSAAGVQTLPSADPWLLHTNHPLAAASTPSSRPRGVGSSRENSEARLSALLEAAPELDGPGEIQNLLAGPRLCVVPSEERPVVTFGTIIMSLTSLRMRVALGRPDRGPWTETSASPT